MEINSICFDLKFKIWIKIKTSNYAKQVKMNDIEFKLISINNELTSFAFKLFLRSSFCRCSDVIGVIWLSLN
jgi:hypothetical protein